LSIKIVGEVKDQHVPLFEQVCVLREVDLHYTWAPFCSSSMTVAELDKLDVVGWFLIGLEKFGLARDGCFRVVGCDNIMEDGSFILTGHGIQDNHVVAPPAHVHARSTAPSANPSPSSATSSRPPPPPPPKHGSSRSVGDKKAKSIGDKRAKSVRDNNVKMSPTSFSEDRNDSSSSSDNEVRNDSSNSSSSDTLTSSSDYDFLAQDPLLKQLPIPPVPTRRGAGRMTIRRFDAMITVTSPTSASTIIIANIDPNISHKPNHVLLEFVVKHLAGVMLFKLQGAAKKAVKHPVTNEHAKRMRAEEAFYKHWLLPKFQAVCLDRGWEMPPVAAFELTPNELRKENNNTRKNKRGLLAVAGQDLQHEPQKNHATAAPATTRRAVTFHEGCHMDETDADNDSIIVDNLQPNINVKQQKRFINRRRTMTDPPPSFDLTMRQAEEEGAGKGQRHHHDHDHDLISELSSRSGHNTPWPQLQHALAKGGPVGRFIRQQEIKQVRKHEDKVEKAREKISNMLKPKELDEQQMKRLQQLKLAKARRLAEEQGIMDLSSASFLLSPLKRSDSAPSLTQLVAWDHSHVEMPTRKTTTSGMGMTSLVLPTTVSSRLPLGLDESGTISAAATTAVPPLQRQLKHERQQPATEHRHATTTSIIRVPEQRRLHRRRSFLRFVTDRLYTHGRIKKVLVVSLMVALLFVSLHPRLLLLRMKPPKFLPTHNETTDQRQQQQRNWWEAAACLCLDVVTSLYLCACAILHFFLCDISLVYAFDSLELGAKTGRQVRKFYIDNVRFPVALTSFGIVAISLIKALSRVGLRAVLWFLLASYNAATGRSSSLVKTMQELGATVLPDVVGDYCDKAVLLWARIFLLVLEVMRVCLAIPFNFVVHHAIGSNWLGRSAETQLVQLFHAATTSARGAIDVFEGKVEVAPWRMEAFETARSLFAYSAVFLVTALILFSISAGQKRRAAKTVRIDSRTFTDDSFVRMGIKEGSAHPPPAAVLSSPATTTSLKEDIIRKKDDDHKNNRNNIARLESSLQSFGVSSQHDAESEHSPDSSHNNSNSSSSDNKKAHGVLRFRKSTFMLYYAEPSVCDVKLQAHTSIVLFFQNGWTLRVFPRRVFHWFWEEERYRYAAERPPSKCTY
jgi:hypothetical protein